MTIQALDPTNLSASILPGVSAIAESDWTRLFPDDAEGWAYYRAIEAAPPPGFRFEAIAVHDGGHLVAAAPELRVT
jgi:hypothetical protein